MWVESARVLRGGEMLFCGLAEVLMQFDGDISDLLGLHS